MSDRRREDSKSRSRSKSPKSRKEKKKKKEKKKDKEERKRDGKDADGKAEDEQMELSIEETNRLRVSMGLEPLAKAVEDDEVALQAAKAEMRKRRNEEREKEDKAADAKRKKVEQDAKAKLKGVDSLGKELATETGGSASDWVARSRKIDKAKQEAETRAREIAEQEETALPEYSTEHLAGVKVDHTSKQMQEGAVYTMTLKDTYILNKDSTAENMEEDTLENSDLVAQEVAEKNKKLKTQTHLYDVYDDEANATLLPQYEDDKPKDTMRLTGEEDERAVKLREIRDKLKKTVPKEEDARKQSDFYDLNTEKAVPSDYLPAKPEKFKKKRKKEGGERKTGKAQLFDEDKNDVATHQQDHGSRDGGGVKAAAEQLAAERNKQLKDQAYLKALNRAEKDSKKLLESLEHVFEEEQDEELRSSLDRSRRLAQERAAKPVKREKQSEADEKKDLDRAERIKTFKKEDMDDVPVKEDLVFTATTEFCRGLASVSAVNVPEAPDKFVAPRPKAPKKAKLETKAAEPEPAAEENEDHDDDDEEMKASDEENGDFMGEEPMAAGGAAAALALAKLRGLLKEEISQAGRSQDETYHYEDPSPNISLNYQDEFGRPMKPKEAFRQLSHVFHGRPPGPVKLEKKLKQFREEQRRGRILYGSRKSTLDNFVKKQKKAGEAYVVLDGTKKGAYDVGAGVQNHGSRKQPNPME